MFCSRMGNGIPASCTTTYQKWTGQPIHLAGSKNPLPLGVGSVKIESNEYLDSPGIHHFQDCRGTILDGIYDNCIRSEYTNKPDQFAKVEEDKENDYSRD